MPKCSRAILRAHIGRCGTRGPSVPERRLSSVLPFAYPFAVSIRVGIVGVSGYGGGEALRLCASHPAFEVVYVAGESSAGAKLSERFPGMPQALGELVIQKWDAAALPAGLDLLFASLPTGESREALA